MSRHLNNPFIRDTDHCTGSYHKPERSCSCSELPGDNIFTHQNQNFKKNNANEYLEIASLKTVRLIRQNFINRSSEPGVDDKILLSNPMVFSTCIFFIRTTKLSGNIYQSCPVARETYFSDLKSV